MKLPDSEKEAITTISNISGVSEPQVREVFLSMLFTLTTEIHRGTNQISIPFFGDFKIHWEKLPGNLKPEIVEQTFVKLNPIVRAVLLDISEGREPVVQKHIKSDVSKYFAKQLGVKHEPSPDFAEINSERE